jgi:hypothetical protein
MNLETVYEQFNVIHQEIGAVMQLRPEINKPLIACFLETHKYRAEQEDRII